MYMIQVLYMKVRVSGAFGPYTVIFIQLIDIARVLPYIRPYTRPLALYRIQ